MTNALSTLNFRDLGGLRTTDGRRVRAGVIYRSEGPTGFLTDHRRELKALGVRSVCDLRSAGERTLAPNDWCSPDCRLLHLDMNIDPRAGAAQAESLRSDSSADEARRMIIRNYALMPAALIPHLSSMTEALIAGEIPMIIHCTAGKDRTGVVIALILSLLGVSRDAILIDYRRSDIFGQNMRTAGTLEEIHRKIFGFVPSDEVVEMLIATHGDFLLAALAAVDNGWGAITRYFVAGGVSLRHQDKLRAALLE